MCTVSNANKKEIFEIGDLVVFSGVSQSIIKNQIGIVIGDSMISAVEDEFLKQDDWYVVQFGTMKLIVNDTMIEKLDYSNE
jgi:hypothetical protein